MSTGMRQDLKISTAKSYDMHEYGKQYAPLGVMGSGRYWKPYPLYIEQAEGSHIVDVDGNRFIDYHAAYGPAILGHNHPELREAVIDSLQSKGVLFALPHEAELQLAKKITEVMPSAEKVIYTCAGTEATFHAVRLARAFTGRDRVLKFEGAYHGWHDYVNQSVKPSLNLAGDPRHPNVVPGSKGTPAAITALTDVLPWNDEGILEEFLETNGEHIACLIVEPIIHSCGVLMPKPGFLEFCREQCTKHGILLIFDEIVTGFRHGLGGVQKIMNVTPDLTTFGKAIANGYPLSGLAGRRDIMSHMQPEGDVAYQGTFNGILMSMVAGLKTLEILERDRVHDRIFAMGDLVSKEINAEIDKLGVPARCRNFGSVWCLYFTDTDINNYRDVARFGAVKNSGIDSEFQAYLLDHGVYMQPYYANRCYISFAHTDDDIAKTIDAVKGFIRSNERRIREVNA